jgi:predicted AAA+ superfamily ATPase
MFVGFSVPAYSKSPRKNLLSTAKFFLFDMGVRHASEGLPPSRSTVNARPGPFLEQWVGIELWKRLQYLGQGRLLHLRTKDGSEVDFIIETRTRVTPIEVKYTQHPSLSDARHLLTFMAENPRRARHAYIICRCPRPLALHGKVTALPWFYL